MSWIKDSKNSSLKEATKAGDVNRTRELLDQGADPNILVDHEPPFEFTKNTAKVPTEIIKLLVKYGVTIDRKLARAIFKPPLSYYAEEIVTNLFNYHKDHKSLNLVFEQLVLSKDFKGLKILELLLENGFSVNSSYYYEKNTFAGSITPLHLCILQSKVDYVLMLLKHGADINKKSSGGSNALCLAVIGHDLKMVEILLKKDVKIDEVSHLSGLTALCMACQQKDVEIIKVLLDYGAEICYSDENQTMPLELTNRKVEAELLIKELSKELFAGRQISPKISVLLELNQSEKYFYECLAELKLMKDCNFYYNLSLFDILKFKYRCKKLISLAKNADFITAFENSTNTRESLIHFKTDLDNIFQCALEMRDILQLEEEKLYSIFKNYLPEVVINKIAFFSFE